MFTKHPHSWLTKTIDTLSLIWAIADLLGLPTLIIGKSAEKCISALLLAVDIIKRLVSRKRKGRKQEYTTSVTLDY